MKAYVISEDKKIFSIDQNIPFAKSMEEQGFDIAPWDTNISGNFPDLEKEFVDPRDYSEKRRNEYSLDFDEKWIRLEGRRLDGDVGYTKEEIDNIMRIKKNEIKEKYPKPD